MNKPNTYLEIDLGAIKNNVLEIKKRICPRIFRRKAGDQKNYCRP